MVAVSGSAFVEQWVGTGAARVRELFELARQYAPVIIFIDELDALAMDRTKSNTLNGEYLQTVNQLLTELDNLDKERNQNVVVIGATNKLDNIDAAVLRSGRLGKHIFVPLPNLYERGEILKLYAGKVNIAAEVDLKKIAGQLMGFSGADIESLVNEAALHALTENKSQVTMKDFIFAEENFTLGRLSKTANVLQNEKEITAYHEAGHALVGMLSKSYPYKIYKITIGVRNETLGMTSFHEDEERYNFSREALIDIIAMKLAGKIAEQIIYGENNFSNRAVDDLKGATVIAQDMIMKEGMGEQGLYISYAALEKPPTDLVNKQIEAILTEAAARARKILIENKSSLEAVAKELLVKEILTAEEVNKIISSKRQ